MFSKICDISALYIRSAHVDLDLHIICFLQNVYVFKPFGFLYITCVLIKWHAIGIHVYTVYIVPPFVQIFYQGLQINTCLLNASLSLLHYELLQSYCDFAFWVYYVHKMVGLAWGWIRRSSSLLYPWRPGMIRLP